MKTSYIGRDDFFLVDFFPGKVLFVFFSGKVNLLFRGLTFDFLFSHDPVFSYWVNFILKSVNHKLF